MNTQSLEDLALEKVFSVSHDLLQNKSINSFRFFMKNSILAERPSQKLLNKCLTNNIDFLTHFAPFLSNLSNINLQKSLYFESFDFLNKFNLSSFSCRSMKNFEIDEFLENFNEKTRLKMRYLKLRKIDIRLNQPLSTILQFVSVKVLDLSHTRLTSSSLAALCGSLSCLVALNIAHSLVDDFSPLTLLSKQLEYLDIHDVPSHFNIFNVLKHMDKLRHLDMSLSTHQKTILSENDSVILTAKFLSSLRLLDISGHQGNLTTHFIFETLNLMPRLKYFIFNPDSSLQNISNIHKFKKYIKANPQLTVIGAFTKQTMLNSLLYSLQHRRYLTSSLHQLFDKTRASPFINQNLNETLLIHLKVIKTHKHDLAVAITAVLYNLTKGRFVENWSLSQLSELMKLLVTFLENSPNFQQLTVNIFLIICNDFIIQNAVYDKLRLSQLIFHGLARYDAENISQAGVIIISVIASELTKDQLKLLVLDRNNFQILLSLVCRRCVFQEDLATVSNDSYLADLRSTLRSSGDPVFDYTLKFTLSSLWNLTDECTVACNQFVQQQGLLIYFIMIDKFQSASSEIYSHIYNKCLGLLNNIAEESTCRLSLLTQKYMDFLIDMLDQEDIQMTYFAGGILSNLLLISDLDWKDKCRHDKAFYENRIYVAVDSWVSPDYLMASYRSFCPFENLISNAGSSRAILLWALWAIRHTMKIERVRYATILGRHSQLIEYLELLAMNHNPLYARIRGLAADIMLLFKGDCSDNDIIYQMMIE